MWCSSIFGTKWHRFNYCSNLWWVQPLHCINTLDCLVGTNPFSKPRVPICHFEYWENSVVKIQSWTMCIWKFCLCFPLKFTRPWLVKNIILTEYIINTLPSAIYIYINIYQESGVVYSISIRYSSIYTPNVLSTYWSRIFISYFDPWQHFQLEIVW